MDNETFRATQILALQAVDSPTYDDFYRSCCRWFSEKFSTPLKEVEEYADLYVLRHYYESMYGEVKDATGDKAEENYELLKASILQTEVEQSVAEMDDDAWARELNEEVAKQTSEAMVKVMEEIDTHIKEVQQGGEIFEGFDDDEMDSDDEIN